MKKLTMFVASLILVFVLCNFANAQTVQLTIANQSAVLGGDPTTSYFQFDIDLKATVGDVYLGTSDIVLDFNSTNFTSPADQINDNSDDGSTFASLMNSNSIAVNSQATSYEDLLSLAPITSNEIILNLNNPSVTNQTTFNKAVAKLSNGVTYKFGTYRIYGISTSTGTMGLVWVSASTKLYTFANTTPWALTLVTNDLSVAIPDASLPVELTSFTASVSQLNADLKWSTATEVNNYGFDIERRVVSNQPSAVSSWTKVGFVKGNGTSNDTTFIFLLGEYYTIRHLCLSFETD